jgi:hypothetical protein
MPTAHEVAVELRNLADHLDTQPFAVIDQPWVIFSSKYKREGKTTFLALAALLPKPLVKGDGYGHNDVTLTFENPGIRVTSCIEKYKMRKDRLALELEVAEPCASEREVG